MDTSTSTIAGGASSVGGGDYGSKASDGGAVTVEKLYADNANLEHMTTRKYRQPTTTVSLKDRYRVIKYMLEEEKKGTAKHVRDIYFSAVTKFPECFLGSDKANKEKARYWWNERHRDDLPLLALTIPNQTKRYLSNRGRTEHANEGYNALKRLLRTAIFDDGIEDEKELMKMGVYFLINRYPTVGKTTRRRQVGNYARQILAEKMGREMLDQKGNASSSEDEYDDGDDNYNGGGGNENNNNSNVKFVPDNYSIRKGVNDVDDNDDKHIQLETIKTYAGLRKNKNNSRKGKKKKSMLLSVAAGATKSIEKKKNK